MAVEFSTTRENKLEACRSARALAGQTFAVALGELLKTEKPISEAGLRDEWQQRLIEKREIFPEGWYISPPSKLNGSPHGIGTLFANEAKNKRVNYDSLRRPPNHPQENIYFDKKTGMMYVYASPVDRKTGMIGDWGGTFYIGNNPDIIERLKHCWEINRKIVDQIKVGMTFQDLTSIAFNLFEREGVYNEVLRTDTSQPGNIGHTVPASYEDWSNQEIDILNKYKQDDPQTWEAIYTLISGKRKYIDPTESLAIKPNMAFTLEPRLTIRNRQAEIPMSSFHGIVTIDGQGNIELLTNFQDTFELIMPYMLEK